MAGFAGGLDNRALAEHARALREPPWVRRVLIGTALAFLAVFLVVPLVTVFASAFRDGIAPYVRAITESDARSAIRLTLLVAAIAVPLNVAFGIAAAWAITRFQFPGKVSSAPGLPRTRPASRSSSRRPGSCSSPRS